MIDRETQQKIKDAANIVEVVGDYVKLTRRGANYMGLCPFHNERTPSFSVSPRKNFCHCFSCKKGGSPVNFLMEKEGIGYTDALLLLAKKYNIPVQERELSDEERRRMSEREAMVIASEWAMSYFHDNLYNTEEGRDIGLAYLYGRGITDEAIRKYKLGYSLDRGDALILKARSEGYDIDVLKSIGLVGTSQQGRGYDKFRGRVMFPIRNASGKPVAFGGRALKGEAAKYINSPETPLYKKSNELYGIFEAKGDIMKEERVFLMEGYLDVIGSWQSGLRNAVASSGTALTESQISLLHRFTDNVTLIYDGDNAGIKASLRGIDMLLAQNLHVKVLLLPEGDDPDSFARKHTPEEFRAYIDSHQTDFIKYKLGVLLKEAGGSPQEISEAVRNIVGSIASIPDEIERISYIKECALRVGIDEKVIARQVAQAMISRSAAGSGHREYQDFRTAVKIPEQPEASQQPPREVPENTVSHAFMQKEREILRCCVRYAYLPLPTEENAGGLVIDYVREEMEADGIRFSDPRLQNVFDILSDRRGEFIDAFGRYRQEVEKCLEKDRQAFRDVLRMTGGSMAKLSQEEERHAKEESEKRIRLYKEYAINFSEDYLVSHENAGVREVANPLVAERHVLSAIYTGAGSVSVMEEDRLDHVISRALSELRSEILNRKVEELQSKMTDAITRGDSIAQEAIMTQLTKLLHIRSRLAEDLGERIIAPE